MENGVDNLADFRVLVTKLISEYVDEWGELPTQLKVPDAKWFLVDMAIADAFHTMSKEKQQEMILKGSAKRDYKYMGLGVFGTIRQIHVI